MQPLYPLQFVPIYKQYVWGGNRMKTVYGHADSPVPCSEAWVISDRDEGMSVVAYGPLRGVTLRQLMQERGNEIAGSIWKNIKTPVFPLLIKILDAGERLSVQVHPDEETAKLYGGEPKTEMWYVLDADKDSYVYTGLKKNVDRNIIERSLKDGTIEAILNKIHLNPHMAIYVPGGRIHAIGGGCLLLEIQQNSNTTYRLYDWNRVDKSGKSRELHVKHALQATRWHDDRPICLQPALLENSQNNKVWNFLTCPYFKVKRMKLSTDKKIIHNGESCHIFFVVTGCVSINVGSIPVNISAGTASLLPACIKQYTLSPVSTDCVLLDITLC